MRTADLKAKDKKGKRVLIVAEDHIEFAKDNLGVVRKQYKNGIEFDDEREAIDKLLACFKNGKVCKKKVSKKKVSKKKVTKKVIGR